MKAAEPLERVALTVTEDALPAFEAALSAQCEAVGFFRDEASGLWTLEGIRRPGDAAALEAALALAAAVAGVAPPPIARSPTAASGWLEKVAENFPPQPIGKRFLVVGTHDRAAAAGGRIRLVLDAGLAFGSGEHGSTRGCLRALEGVSGARRILDLGTGSGILAIAAARRFRRKVLASDIDFWSVRVATANARDNAVPHLVRAVHEAGVGRRVRAGAPYDLILANILARPLCAMAKAAAGVAAPGATIILAGLLVTQANQVEAAWRRQGCRRLRRIAEGRWTTLVLQAPRKAARRPPARGIAV